LHFRYADVRGSLTDEAAMNPKRTRILAAVAAFLGALNMHGQPPSDGSVPFPREMPGVFGPVTARIKAGDRAPDISFTKVLQPAGTPLTSVTLTGRTTVLVFFPQISPNSQAIAAWNDVVEHFAGKPVQFIMITSEKESILLPWLAQHPVGGTVLYDPHGRTGRSYGLELMIDSVYIGSDGKIVGFLPVPLTDDYTLNAVLEGRITTAKPSTDKASVNAFLASHVVPLNAEPLRWGHPGDNKPNLPPSNTLHVSPTKDETGSGEFRADDFWNLQGFTLMQFIAKAYDLNPIRIVLPASFKANKRYDFAFVAPEHQTPEEMQQHIQQGIQDHFHLSATYEDRLMNVYVITAPNGKPPAHPDPNDPGSVGSASWGSTGNIDENGMLLPAGINAVRSIDLINGTVDDFCHMLEQGLDHPLINETHLDGKFDFRVRAEEGQQNNFTEHLRTQLNLVVTPAQRHVEMFVFTPQ
jgi:uncharacterized protein (TIGR03435 family)